jgi:hypothetical protein
MFMIVLYFLLNVERMKRRCNFSELMGFRSPDAHDVVVAAVVVVDEIQECSVIKI